MEKARCNTELYSNLNEPLNNVKPSNFLRSHHYPRPPIFSIVAFRLRHIRLKVEVYLVYNHLKCQETIFDSICISGIFTLRTSIKLGMSIHSLIESNREILSTESTPSICGM